MEVESFLFKTTLQFRCPNTEVEFDRLKVKLESLGFKNNGLKPDSRIMYVWVNECYKNNPSISGGYRFAYRYDSNLNEVEGEITINNSQPYDEKEIFQLLDKEYFHLRGAMFEIELKIKREIWENQWQQ